MTNTNCTTKTLNTTTIGTITLTAVSILEIDLFSTSTRGNGQTHYVATAGTAHSGYCADACEALDRVQALINGWDITEAPKGSCNRDEMARAVAKFDAGLAFRDGGVCENAIRIGAAAGLHSPEWVVASRHVGQNGLWR